MGRSRESREESIEKKKKAGNQSIVGMSAQSTPQIGRCSRCRRTILSARYDALLRHWDPQPLSQIGELRALTLGLKTWWLFAPNRVYKRHSEAITASPTGLGGVIIRDHDCAHPHPTGLEVDFGHGIYDREEPDF